MPAITALRCTQCGAELNPEAGQVFVTCGACGSTVYVDKTRVVFHWWVAPTLNSGQAQAALRAWMAGNDTVKDLDRKAQLTGQTFSYFPMWYFRRRVGQKDEIYLEPAAAISVSELRSLRLPAGDLKKYDATLDSQAVSPTVPLTTALDWLAQRKVPADQVAEAALVHIPLYTFKYAFNGRGYTALVEAATGRALANVFPAKAEAPFVLAGALTALVFACLALIPAGGGLLAESQGLTLGLLVCSGLAVLAMPPLFALAAWIAAKI